MNKHIDHSCLVLFAAFVAVASSASARAAQLDRPPNILIILADDMGYAEMGCQGNKDVPTPNIDSLAKNGVRFTNGYVSCPICAPTRAGLMTGRYQQRFGFETNPGPEAYADEKFGLPRSETTLAERLKAAGYVTGMFGKWHLGYQPDLQPTARGFDDFFGFLSGANNYLLSASRGESRNPILRGTQTIEEQEYLSDAFGREAVAFIEKHREKPFFVYLPFNAVHSPLEASEKYHQRFPAISDPKRRGDWKLVQTRTDPKPQLYNLAKDIGETTDLADKEPAKFKELNDAWAAWNAQLMAPQWHREDARTKGQGAPPAGGARRSGGIEERFRQFDRNGDGRLTPDEFPRAGVFKLMDQNNDGVVTFDEAKAYFGSARRGQAAQLESKP